MPVKEVDNSQISVFSVLSNGIVTNRDVWSFNSSKRNIENCFNRCISFYNSQLENANSLGDKFEIVYDAAMIKWDSTKERHFKTKKKASSVNPNAIVTSLYRPYIKQFLYNDSEWIARSGQMPKLYPHQHVHNMVIGISGIAAKGFSCLAANYISDYHFLESGSQVLPRYVFRKADQLDKANGLTIDEYGYVREDAIKPEAVEHFRNVYGAEGASIDADAVFYYIYGLLHSKDYRGTYANNLVKELPRIPRVETYAEFKAFEQAGRKLAELHVNYESVTPYNGCTIEKADNVHYRVEKLAYGKIKGKTGNAAKDKTCIVYNETLTIKNIPLEAQEYIVNLKSALDWVVERCCVKQDKETGIVNDYNDYATEVGDEKYIFNLILRVITVSLETVKIVNSLPKLNIHPLDK